MPQAYDVIVVGAGPAGATAAYFTAQAGLKTALLERGPYPGSKNLGGAGLYVHMVEPLFPDLMQTLPHDGEIVRQEFWLLDDHAALAFGYRNDDFARPPHNRLSVLRAKLDPWLAQQAVKAGAKLLTSHHVEKLLVEGGKVVGVRVGKPQGRDLYAPLTILAEGVNRLLATSAGLAPRPQATEVSLYVKEIVSLPPETIQERFGLLPGQAAVIGFYGGNTLHLSGTGSIYTCQHGVGINSGVLVKTLQQAKVNPFDFLVAVKRHPALAPLLEGGRTVEYAAHLIPDGGYPAIPELVHPGCLLTGDAAGFVNGTHGINLAMHSGKMAADTARYAFDRGQFDRHTLNAYRDLLDDSFVMQDMKANRHVPGYYEHNKDLYDRYGHFVHETAYHVAMVYPVPRRLKRGLLWKEIRTAQPLWRTARDAINTLRVMY